VLLLTRGLPVLIELGLLVFCLIECIRTPADEQRNLPRWAWIVLILLVPLVGSIAWLVAGRPRRGRGAAPWPSTASAGFPEHGRPRRAAAPPRGPDDDPEFLASLAPDAEKQRLLEQWEADLRRREERLREDGDERGGPSPS
jgi:hypothetical protein